MRRLSHALRFKFDKSVDRIESVVSHGSRSDRKCEPCAALARNGKRHCAPGLDAPPVDSFRSHRTLDRRIGGVLENYGKLFGVGSLCNLGGAFDLSRQRSGRVHRRVKRHKQRHRHGKQDNRLSN